MRSVKRAIIIAFEPAIRSPRTACFCLCRVMSTSLPVASWLTRWFRTPYCGCCCRHGDKNATFLVFLTGELLRRVVWLSRGVFRRVQPRKRFHGTFSELSAYRLRTLSHAWRFVAIRSTKGTAPSAGGSFRSPHAGTLFPGRKALYAMYQ